MEKQPEEQLVIPGQEAFLDSLAFRLARDGIKASVKLHLSDPEKGVTPEQAKETLQRWFPDYFIELDDPEEPTTLP